jgi:hypothetical protein
MSALRKSEDRPRVSIDFVFLYCRILVAIDLNILGLSVRPMHNTSPFLLFLDYQPCENAFIHFLQEYVDLTNFIFGRNIAEQLIW